jgi:hypothetical protein
VRKGDAGNFREHLVNDFMEHSVSFREPSERFRFAENDGTLGSLVARRRSVRSWMCGNLYIMFIAIY